MSAATATAPVAFDDRHTHTTLWHVIRSEWTKFWSVRSTAWTLLVLVIATVGFSVLASWGTVSSLSQMTPEQRATLDPTSTTLAGVAFGQLALAVLGALIITTEYSTGGVKATFTAVPSRLKVLTAKGLILAAASLIVGLITSFAAFYAALPFFASHHMAPSLSDSTVLRAVIGGGLYLMASALFGLALGAIIRHTAGAITAAVALLLVVPPLLNLLPGTWGHDIYKVFTSNAGSRIGATVPDHTLLTPWAGYLTMTVWWLVPLLAGAYLLNRRDA